MLRPLVSPLNLRQRFLRRAAGVTILGVLLFLVLLPPLLTQLIRYQLPRMGLGQIEIGNIDINLFRGRVSLQEVELYRAAALVFSLQRADLDLSILSLFDHRLHLQSLRLQGLAVTAQQRDGRLYVAGVALPAGTEEEPAADAIPTSQPWGFGIDELAMHETALQLIHPQFTEAILLDNLAVGPIATWRLDVVTPAALQMRLRDATLRVTAQLNPFTPAPHHQLEVSLDSLSLAPFAALARPYIAGLQGVLSTQMKIEIESNPAQGLALRQQGGLKLTDLRLQQGESILSEKGLDWRGELQWSDVADIRTLQLHGDLQLDGVALQNVGQKAPAIALQRLGVTGIELSGLQRLSISEIGVDGLDVEVRRASSGTTLRGLPVAAKGNAPPEKGTTEASAEESSTATATPSVELKIGRLLLSGNNRITFVDQTVKPSFSQSVVITSAELQSIDTTRPEQPSPLKLVGKDDNYTRFSVTGEVRPLAQELSLDLKGDLSDLDLPPASPYVAQLMGYRITTGQLNSKVSMKISGKAMKGEVALKLNQLKLEEEDPARIEAFQGKSTLPLNTALSLLRDSDDNINLKLPISGQLDDPQFELADIINTALAKSLKMASVSYLKHLLQPYGALISVVQMAGKAAGQIQLDPLQFSPGSSELPADAPAYLERINKLLEKKTLNVRLCGFATTADLLIISKGKEKSIPAAGHPALEALAKARAEQIKAYLVTSLGAAPKQLFVCHPQLDAAKEAIARVELSI